jgi:hypothetical protein
MGFTKLSEGHMPIPLYNHLNVRPMFKLFALLALNPHIYQLTISITLIDLYKRSSSASFYTGCASKNGTHKAYDKFKFILSNNSIYDDIYRKMVPV